MRNWAAIVNVDGCSICFDVVAKTVEEASYEAYIRYPSAYSIKVTMIKNGETSVSSKMKNFINCGSEFVNAKPPPRDKSQ